MTRWLLLDLESVQGIVVALAFLVLAVHFVLAVADAVRGKK